MRRLPRRSTRPNTLFPYPTLFRSAAARRNVFTLAICMALSNSAVTLQVTLGGLVGSILAEDKALATLPVTCVVTGMALSTIPARSEEHTSELQSLMRNSYSVFCLKKNKPLHKYYPDS